MDYVFISGISVAGVVAVAIVVVVVAAIVVIVAVDIVVVLVEATNSVDLSTIVCGVMGISSSATAIWWVIL